MTFSVQHNRYPPEPILPDILAPNLQVVFCGSAASNVSAKRGAYYAHPQNRFWPIIYALGLTNRLLTPEEYTKLPEQGVGLTDMAKHHFGGDAVLPKNADDPAGLKARIARYSPKFLAFNGKRAAQVFFKHCFNSKQVSYGLQQETIGSTELFVLPSTSPAAVRYWDETPWRTLAQQMKNV